jgi:hypothetical protein
MNTPFTSWAFASSDPTIAGTIATLGSVTNAGNGYGNGTYNFAYLVSAINGRLATASVTISSNAVSSVTLKGVGGNYQAGESVTLDRTQVGGKLNTFTNLTGTGTPSTTFHGVAVAGSVGNGSGGTVDVTVDSGGNVSACVVNAAGNGYLPNDTVSGSVAGLSGFTAVLLTVTGTDAAITVSTVASIAPTTRTQPDRISDIINVKDYGAIGDGVHDDTPNIQAAVLARGSNAGIIFFPSGKYLVTAPIIFFPQGSGSIIFQGNGVQPPPGSGGAGGTQIIGNFSDYIIRITTNYNGVGTGFFVQDMNVYNSSATGGCIWFDGVNQIGVYRCYISGYHGITQAAGTENFSCRDCTFFTNPGTPAGSWGVYLAGSASVVDTCIFQGIDRCIQIGNTGPDGFTAGGAGGVVLSNNRMEGQVGTAILVGADLNGNNSSGSQLSIISNTSEGCGVSIDIIDGNNFSIENCICNLSSNAPGGTGTYGIRVRSGSSYKIINTGIGTTGPSYTVAGLSIESQDPTAIIENTSSPSFAISDPRFSPIFVNCPSLSNEGRRATTLANAPTSPWVGMTQVFNNLSSNTPGATASSGGSKLGECAWCSDSVWRVTKQLSA